MFPYVADNSCTLSPKEVFAGGQSVDDKLLAVDIMLLGRVGLVEGLQVTISAQSVRTDAAAFC